MVDCDNSNEVVMVVVWYDGEVKVVEKSFYGVEVRIEKDQVLSNPFFLKMWQNQLKLDFCELVRKIDTD